MGVQCAAPVHILDPHPYIYCGALSTQGLPKLQSGRTVHCALIVGAEDLYLGHIALSSQDSDMTCFSALFHAVISEAARNAVHYPIPYTGQRSFYTLDREGMLCTSLYPVFYKDLCRMECCAIPITQHEQAD